MHDTFTVGTNDMPTEMHILLSQYPRDNWKAHPGFREKTQHWLDAHQMFRRLGKLVGPETELYLDQMRAPEGYAARLSYYGDALVRNPQGHHGWVDHSYFPELSAADPRFDADLDILKQDHKSLDGVLATFPSFRPRSGPQSKPLRSAGVCARVLLACLRGLSVRMPCTLSQSLRGMIPLCWPG